MNNSIVRVVTNCSGSLTVMQAKLVVVVVFFLNFQHSH